jgi:hypothetical protein
MSEPWLYPDTELRSDCCDAVADGEVIDGIGICSKCKEHASFTNENEDDNQ